MSHISLYILLEKQKRGCAIGHNNQVLQSVNRRHMWIQKAAHGVQKKIQGQSEVLADQGGEKDCGVNNPQIFLMFGQLEAHWRKSTRWARTWQFGKIAIWSEQGGHAKVAIVHLTIWQNLGISFSKCDLGHTCVLCTIEKWIAPSKIFKNQCWNEDENFNTLYDKS